MTNYLDRMIKRINGELPVMKPLVRSSYQRLPFVNENKSEFIETVLFDAGDSQAIPDMTPPAQDFTHAPEPVVKNSSGIPIGETNLRSDIRKSSNKATDRDQVAELLKTPGNPSLETKVHAVRLVISPGEERTITPINILSPDDKRIHKDSVSKSGQITAPAQISLPKRKSSVKTSLGDASPERKLMDNQIQPQAFSPAIANPEGTLKAQSLVEKREFQAKNVPHNISNRTKTVSVSQPDKTDLDLHLTRIEKNPASDLVKRGYRTEDIKPPTREEKINASRSPVQPNHISVTIGRIEIKAVNAPVQPVPQTQPVSKSPEPIISLESYLKNRDEARR
jgi:hypothetical protein